MIPTDKISESKIADLHPWIANAALRAYREAVRITPVGIHPVITETIRSFELSDHYYTQGRTRPGEIISFAKGGQSFHNYALALDFTIEVQGRIEWKMSDNWMLVVNTFKEYGFEWGGDWPGKKADKPHLQMVFGYTWQELLWKVENKEIDKNGFVYL